MTETNTNIKNTFQKRKFKKPYKAKPKGKGKKTTGSNPSQKSIPVFTYNCVCHGVQATKVPCVRSEEHNSTLGSWRCSVTNKPTKVTRIRNKAEEVVAC